MHLICDVHLITGFYGMGMFSEHTLAQNMSVEANLVRACSVNKVSSIMAEFTTTKRVHAVWRIPVQRTRRSNVLEVCGLLMFRESNN